MKTLQKTKTPFKNEVITKDLHYIYNKIPELSKLNGSSILITGCAGFLGFYLLHFLAYFAKKLQLKTVLAIDNYQLGHPAWIQQLQKEYASVLRICSIDIVKGDLMDPLKQVPEIDYVLHLASIASPTFYRQYPLETIDANIWGLRRLLDAFRTKNLKGLLFFSSSEIYGDPDPASIPTKEEYLGLVSCVGPRACYDESKRFGETLCWVHAEKYQMPITVVRPFNNFGPGMKLEDRRIPADFAKAVLEGRDLTLYSDGTPTRTFCYIADAIIGYLKALLYGRFDTFNIGIDTPEISMQHFAQIFQKKGGEIFGYSGKVVLQTSKDKDYLTNNPSRRCPDIEKAKRLLGFSPTIDVETGVEKFLRYLKIERENK